MPMARRFSSFGFLGIFGRSSDLRAMDAALRSVDLHPRLVPEAVKLAAVRIVAEAAGDSDPAESAYLRAAELLAYCMIGAEGFTAANGEAATAAAEARLERAIDDEDGADARIVLLAIHAKVMQPSVKHRFGFETSQD